MKPIDFRVGWRLLAKEKGSWLVLAGLAVGLAACFLLFGFVHYCFTYNAHLPDGERIFVVKERRNMLPRPEYRASAPGALAEVALAASPGASRTRAKRIETAARIRERLVPLTLHTVDPNYLAFFGLKAVAGDPAGALARPGVLVLSRAMAQSLFPGEPPLGAVLRISGVVFVVGGIIEDLPGNTTIDADVLLGQGSYPWNAPRGQDPWSESLALYLKLPQGTDSDALARHLQETMARQRDARFRAAWREKAPGGRLTDIALTRLTDIYFDPDLYASRSGDRHGNPVSVLALGALAFLILVLAGVNYLNMVAVQCSQRQREIGIRMSLGAGRSRLAGQFVAESMVAALIATVAGLGLAWLTAPLFANLVERPLTGMLTPASLAIALLAGLLLGAAAGLYPALIALRMPLRAALQGRAGTDSAGALQLRRLLTMLQFGVAGALMALTLAVAWQADYASHADPGFDPSRIVLVSPPGDPAGLAARAFRAELARLDGVAGVAGMSEAVGRDDNTIVGAFTRVDGAMTTIEIRQVGAGFFELYAMTPLHGRLFQPGRDTAGAKSLVVNTLAARELGFDSAASAVGKPVGDDGVIVGIAPELRYRTLRQRPEPMLYQVNGDQPVLAVAAAGERSAVQGRIEALWLRHFPHDVPRVEAATDVFGENYSQERRLGKILASACLVALVLAAFGVYVLAAFSVERRAREIVLRKIHGASPVDIGRLIGSEFLILAGSGGLAGMALAWFGIEHYLSAFVERAPMGVWPLLLSLAGIVLVGLGATLKHTVRAMRMLPVQALRA